MVKTIMIKGMMVKRLLIAFVLVGLTGCDQAVEASAKPTIASMIASGSEEVTSECSKGGVSLTCEFLSGDLPGSGKWHHAKVFISNQGQVDINVDDERFYQTDSDGGFYQGEQVGRFKFKGLQNSLAEVTVRSSNSESKINLAVWDSAGKKIMMASH